MKDLTFKNKTVLAVGAHPDDLEFGCGGTVAKLAEEGAFVYYVILTDGSKGSEDLKIKAEELINIRQKEQKEAAEVLGVKQVFFLGYIDGELENNLEVRRKVVRLVRKIKPDLVITWDPTFLFEKKWGYINHPDHRICGQITLDAVFPFACNSRTFPELCNEGLNSHQVEEVWLFNFFDGEHYTFWIDIKNTLNKKLKALKKHVSQNNHSPKIQEFVKTISLEPDKKNPKESFYRIKLLKH